MKASVCLNRVTQTYSWRFCCQILTLRDRLIFSRVLLGYAVPYSYVFGDSNKNVQQQLRFYEQTKNSALNFSVNVVSVQKGYEMAKFTSFHEGERQGDRFFNIEWL